MTNDGEVTALQAASLGDLFAHSFSLWGRRERGIGRMAGERRRFSMKNILTAAAFVATAFFAQADDRSITEKTLDKAGAVVHKSEEIALDAKDAVVRGAHRANRAARTAWGNSKAYVSADVPVYREGAKATLAGLADEIADAKAQTPVAAPDYFRTRLLALDEQHALLEKRLALMSPKELKDHSAGPRYDFDQCVGDLEQAIDQAKLGADALSKSVQP